MEIIRANSANNLYRTALQHLIFNGTTVSPRGLSTLELHPVTLELGNPKLNVVTDETRKASKAFMAAELLWILMGRSDVEMLSFYNTQISQFSDDGVKLAGAYGPRIMSQLRYAYDTLARDPFSRQAVITIWTPNPAPSKDIPCTVMLHFLLRPPYLDLHVYMRSNDAWLGLPYDLHNFTSLQIIMAKLLKVSLGSYFHIAGSFHLYHSMLDKFKPFAFSDTKGAFDDSMTYTPSLKTFEDLEDYIKTAEMVETEIRTGGKVDQNYLNRFDCPFFKQKLQWLFDKAQKKHAA